VGNQAAWINSQTHFNSRKSLLLLKKKKFITCYRKQTPPHFNKDFRQDVKKFIDKTEDNLPVFITLSQPRDPVKRMQNKV